MHRAMGPVLRACISLGLLCQTAALADGLFVDPCGPPGVKYVGPSSQILTCVLGVNGQSISAGTGVAGGNFFDNHISPVHLSGFTQGENIGPVPYVSETNPTWTIPTTFTLLELDGRVKVDAHDPNAFITLTLTGLLGGCVNAADPGCAGGVQTLGPFTYGPGTSTDISFSSVVEQFTFPLATETLTISLSGNATYNVDGSPEFAGLPEPSTIALSGVSFLICAPWVFFRRRQFVR